MKKIWTLKLSKDVEKSFKALDFVVQKRILAIFHKRILPSQDPYLFGKALQGNLTGYWAYRVGDYRIVAEILEDELLIIAVEVAHLCMIFPLDVGYF